MGLYKKKTAIRLDDRFPVAGAEGLSSPCENSPPDCFLSKVVAHFTRQLLNVVSRPLLLHTQKKEATRLGGFFPWQGQKDLNPRHAVLETAALPTELCPYMVGLQGLEPGTDRL